MSQAEEIRKEARRLLEEGEVKYVVGYRRGPDGLTAAPFFAATPEDAKSLIWDPTCVHNLVRFVRDEKRRKGRAKDPDHRPVAIVVRIADVARGCNGHGLGPHRCTRRGYQEEQNGKYCQHMTLHSDASELVVHEED